MSHPTTRTPKKRRDWKPAFLRAFEETGMATAACKAAGISKSTAYDARHRDEEFALAWHDIEEQTTERMEREAYRRGVEGVERSVYHQGAVVGAERHYSDVLLIFMLKARKPAMYRENVKVEHTGADGAPLGPMFVTDPKLAEDARALLRRAASAGGDEPSGLGAGDE